jgi:hypothetical protein
VTAVPVVHDFHDMRSSIKASWFGGASFNPSYQGYHWQLIEGSISSYEHDIPRAASFPFISLSLS